MSVPVGQAHPLARSTSSSTLSLSAAKPVRASALPGAIRAVFGGDRLGKARHSVGVPPEHSMLTGANSLLLRLLAHSVTVAAP